MRTFEDNYYQWLCELVKVNTSDRSYFLLLKILHKKEFYWTVPNDDNRALDGQRLRDEFLLVNEEPKFRGKRILGPCTMLEMLTGLSRRMEFMLYEPEKGDRTSVWFWIMMSNCRLDRFSDDEFVQHGGENMIMFILNELLERTYKRSGKGGLFPLKHPAKDQRKVEIWYQMCQYILEKCNLMDEKT